jgi:UDPglucose 6-dehydrogenase
MRLSVFGLGHVGLVYAAGFSSLGFKVTGFDIDPHRIEVLNSGETPLFEPNLKELISSGKKVGTLSFTLDCHDAVLASDAIFVVVNTPLDEGGELDLGQIASSCRMIGKVLREADGFRVVVIKSTVPPGTTSGFVKDILEKESGKRAFEDFGLAVNPEFMREASAVRDFYETDRIVIGVNDERSRRVMEEIYSSFKCPKLITSFNNAEMVKYASNSFLAMKISFINMIANICQRIAGSDVEVVAEGMGLDRRITPSLLKPSLGWGGSCWPKDNKALLDLAMRVGVEAPLVESTLEINEGQPLQAIRMAEEELGPLRGRRVAVLGLAFKANTDDVRGAVSRKVISHLLERGAKVVVYDPVAMDNYRALAESNGKTIEYAKSGLECIRDADCAIVVTEWEEFKSITQEDYLRAMKEPVLIDGIRIYDAKKYSGITYRAIGLGPQ